MQIERISLELTDRCDKACWFCYSESQPNGSQSWATEEVVSLVKDCAKNGVRAVSFGGGEPLEHPEWDAIVGELRGQLFRSITTNGIRLDRMWPRLLACQPDKVHVSIHFPQRSAECRRAIEQVERLESAGVAAGINLLVRKTELDAASRAARQLREAGVANDRVVFLPLRRWDTPTPAELAEVAGGRPFQSMTCLTKCAPSERFCAIAADKTAAWCSYTRTRRRLPSLDYEGLRESLDGLGLNFCGGIDDSGLSRSA
ncbi:MAG: radical SAM protein [Pirellulaceae bacterium]|jgi:MoaA/NifB/PqqE/SkfB family radical SAM enzyme|nr:radical SAM protein [Pirellulaceae bacterium]MDP7019912.1 radical SAM protein [Pirellulaceae bacterium]